FSAHKRAAIAQLRYESATRVYLHTRSRFWRSARTEGAAVTDLPIGCIHDFSLGQPGAAGILGTEATAPPSRSASALAEAERVRWGLEHVKAVFPETAENFAGGVSVSWDADPFARGAWAYYAPGEMTSLFPHVATAEGRVHFAGEHTAPVYFLEGAVQ